ncbi:hypothetical protein [Actinoplanes sp. NPDC051851]|uniref:hypothetical protein n=1 Tax=Actinoplanes sp. NPDC051851 TaxID=3154753 RepID=UPI003439B10E
MYSEVDEIAFHMLRTDLMRERSKDTGAVSRRAVSSLTGLFALEQAYREQPGGEGTRGRVPSDRSAWTVGDKQRLLRRLAVILYRQDLARPAFGDEHRLRAFWEDGCFRSVEQLCDEAVAGHALEYSAAMTWLLTSWMRRRPARGTVYAGGRRTAGVRRRPARAGRPGIRSSRLFRSHSTTRSGETRS